MKSNLSTWLKRIIIVCGIIIVIGGAMLLVHKYFTITDINVTGNKHYTEQEVEALIMKSPLDYNSIFLYLKYNNRSLKDIPFIEQMEVEIVTPTSVQITVYEKAVAGYVEYLGHYMYFDKDGIVVESSTKETPGIPFVTGLSFDHMVLHEELPVSNHEVFLLILNITQLLNKYEIETDRISFDKKGEITLYFGDARVFLGTSDFIDEKINEMHLLLPKLEGYSGVLHMENYSGEEVNFSFDVDKEDIEITDDTVDAVEEDADNEN